MHFFTTKGLSKSFVQLRITLKQYEKRIRILDCAEPKLLSPIKFTWVGARCPHEYEPAFVHMNLEGRKLLRNKKRVQVTFTTVGESTVGEEFSLEW